MLEKHIITFRAVEMGFKNIDFKGFLIKT